MSEKKCKIYTFPNKFRVIYQHLNQSLPITSIQVFCKVGSILETEKVRGISHFVEHMCFKGTKKMVHLNEVFENYDEIGAYINAYTEKEFTCYTLKCSDTYVENSTHILADMMLNSTIPKKEFLKEQKVVVEENIRNINDDEWFFFDKLNAIFYDGSSFAYPIDSIDYHPNDTTLKYEHVREWYKYFYHPENMVFSISTNIPFSKIIRVLKTSFFVTNTTIKKRCKSESESESDIALQFPDLNLLPIQKHHSKRIRVELFKKKGLSTNFIGVGFRTCNNKNKDKYLLILLKHVLNELSGRLFLLLREKHGLTYRSSCIVEHKEHTGFFLIQAETDPHKTIYDDITTTTKKKGKPDGVLPIIIDLIRNLREKGITQEELNRFKGNVKGKYLMDLENIDNVTSYNGIEYILSPNDAVFQKDFVEYNDIYKQHIHNITLAQIREVINTYFVAENMIVYIMGKEPSHTYDHDYIQELVEKHFF